MKSDFAMFFGLPILYVIADVFEVLVMIFLIVYCMFLLATHRRLSVWSFFVVGTGTFALRMLISYYYAIHDPYGTFGSPDVAKALTEILFCYAKFLLMWGMLYIVRRFMNKWDFFIKRSILKAVICLAVLTLLFFLNFGYEYLYFMDKPYIYQRVCDFWLSVIPEFYWVDRRRHFL